MKFLSRQYFFILGAVIFVLYSFLRLKHIYFENVGYTYDQGRDFLKAAEIVLYKNLTFIGPVTGIQGLYHGAEWYYILTIPFLLFGGNPVGFYYFNYLIQALVFVIFILFLSKFFGRLTALIISLLIATSGYFIFCSIFVGNNIMVLPSLALLLIANFYLLEKESTGKKWPVIIAGLTLGLVAEFEFAFGLMLIPTYFIATILFKKLRPLVYGRQSVFFLPALIIPFLPRVLFEIKNNFLQTKTLYAFITEPKYYNPKGYWEILTDRANLFGGYYKSIFPSDWFAYAFIISIAAITFLSRKNNKIIYLRSLKFYIYLLTLLFILSTLFKDNFWSNYYEGIHFIYLFAIGILLTPKKISPTLMKFKLLVIFVLLIWGARQFIIEFNKPKKLSDLGMQTEIVEYIQAASDKEYCVKIYTPPVIPYTYEYLFLHKKISTDSTIPSKEWVKDTCWFIIEEDDYKIREQQWTENNLPKTAKVELKKTFTRVTVMKVKRIPQ